MLTCDEALELISASGGAPEALRTLPGPPRRSGIPPRSAPAAECTRAGGAFQAHSGAGPHRAQGGPAAAAARSAPPLAAVGRFGRSICPGASGRRRNRTLPDHRAARRECSLRFFPQSPDGSFCIRRACARCIRPPPFSCILFSRTGGYTGKSALHLRGGPGWERPLCASVRRAGLPSRRHTGSGRPGRRGSGLHLHRRQSPAAE